MNASGSDADDRTTTASATSPKFVPIPPSTVFSVTSALGPGAPEHRHLDPRLAQIGVVLDPYPLDVPRKERRALRCYERFVAATGKGFRPGRWRC